MIWFCDLIEISYRLFTVAELVISKASVIVSVCILGIHFCDLIEIPDWLFIVGTIAINREPVLQIKDQGPIV